MCWNLCSWYHAKDVLRLCYESTAKIKLSPIRSCATPFCCLLRRVRCAFPSAAAVPVQAWQPGAPFLSFGAARGAGQIPSALTQLQGALREGGRGGAAATDAGTPCLARGEPERPPLRASACGRRTPCRAAPRTCCPPGAGAPQRGAGAGRAGTAPREKPRRPPRLGGPRRRPRGAEPRGAPALTAPGRPSRRRPPLLRAARVPAARPGPASPRSPGGAGAVERRRRTGRRGAALP